jgi:hypothetical protein
VTAGGEGPFLGSKKMYLLNQRNKERLEEKYGTVEYKLFERNCIEIDDVL